jgi:hypothetical protein
VYHRVKESTGLQQKKHEGALEDITKPLSRSLQQQFSEELVGLRYCLC